MSEHQAELAPSTMAPAAVVAKPRISADAFRNLTARLKKADVTIPTLSPVVTPPAIVQIESVSIAAAPERVVIPDIVPAFEARVEALEPVLFEPVQNEFEYIAPVGIQPEVVEPEFVAPVVAIPTVAIEEASIQLEPAPIAPVAPVFHEFESLQPISVENSVAAVPEIALSIPDHETSEIAAISVETVDAAPAIEPEVEQTLIVDADPAVAEPKLEGSFAENFTYVPEPGKAAPESGQVDAEQLSSVDLVEVDQAVKKEVAERATQLALENNWRLLLAKPTAEDRATYLREAAEYHEFDEEWNKPAPEHDLSRIEPASIEESIPSISDAHEAPGAMQRSLEDTIPVAEGQDLAELTRSLLDMMAAGNASGLPQERALAADTLLRLVPRLELKPLVMLAQRLSMMDNPPHLLAARLIRDPRVEVAGPLLEDCAHLTDRDLESVVQEGEPAKLRMIARRRKLTRPISDALIKSGDPSVVLTLVRNMEAEISHDGFQSLLVLCENNEELLAPLATRHDLQAPFAFELFWLAPTQLRRFILSRFLTDSETLTKILKITMATQNEDEVEPLSQHALLEALERAARGHMEVAADELSSIMQLSSATVLRILGDVQGDALVVMLKAAGYPRSSVSGLLKRMQDAELPLVTRDREINELQSMFETLSFNKARILLTYWDWAQGKTGPYAPVH